MSGQTHQFGRLLDLWLTYVDAGVETDEARGVPSLLGDAIPDGDSEIDQTLSPEHARRLADWLDAHADALTALAVARGSMPANVREAAAWLRWARSPRSHRSEPVRQVLRGVLALSLSCRIVHCANTVPSPVVVMLDSQAARRGSTAGF
jgi:hypothetical protein